MLKPVLILADGTFPQHAVPLGHLKAADKIVCCDGSAEALIQFGLEPFAIVGDMDSLSPEVGKRYAGRIFRYDDQETNDLTKAVNWCIGSGLNEIVIVGATGKREDHTLGNISLLADYCDQVQVKMVTDTGCFIPFNADCRIECFPGQQVSVFSMDPETEITSLGLKYPLKSKKIKRWWEATLNEVTGDHFELRFSSGKVIVFLTF